MNPIIHKIRNRKKTACHGCGRFFRYSDLASKGSSRGKITTKTHCHPCHYKLKTVPARQKKMDVYIIMKDNKPCQICYNTLPRKAMQFHHIDGRDKKFNISDGVKNCLGWIPSIIPEMKKCIFICGNCHATIHDKKLSISEVKLLIKYKINWINEYKLANLILGWIKKYNLGEV